MVHLLQEMRHEATVSRHSVISPGATHAYQNSIQHEEQPAQCGATPYWMILCSLLALKLQKLRCPGQFGPALSSLEKWCLETYSQWLWSERVTTWKGCIPFSSDGCLA